MDRHTDRQIRKDKQTNWRHRPIDKQIDGQTNSTGRQDIQADNIQTSRLDKTDKLTDPQTIQANETSRWEVTRDYQIDEKINVTAVTYSSYLKADGRGV